MFDTLLNPPKSKAGCTVYSLCMSLPLVDVCFFYRVLHLTESNMLNTKRRRREFYFLKIGVRGGEHIHKNLENPWKWKGWAIFICSQKNVHRSNIWSSWNPYAIHMLSIWNPYDIQELVCSALFLLKMLSQCNFPTMEPFT